jgi:hypothetical protein
MKKDDASFFARRMNFGDISGIDSPPGNVEHEPKVQNINLVLPVLISGILEERSSPDFAEK